MKYLMFLILFPLFVNTSAQTVDSISIKQVDSLIQVSRDLTAKKDFVRAIEVNAEAEKIALSRKPGMGHESAAYANCCFNQGRVLHIKGDHAGAEKWYLKSIAIREKALGKEHPDYATSLNNLGAIYKDMGQYLKAEPLYLETRAIREKVLGREHPDYARSLNNLAFLYLDMGQYEKSEPLYLESRSIIEKTLGREHPDYASILNNLALLYYRLGQYEKTEQLYLQTRAIREKALGKEHHYYASILNNLAILYKDMGDYEKAESFYLESKAILVKALGEEHPVYAGTLNNLANLYYQLGQYPKAEQLYLQARAIREKALGKDHPDYATSLNNLAALYQVMAQYDKAEPLWLEAKATREKSLGSKHPDYATSLSNVGALYRDMRQHEKAEQLYLASKAIREETLGKEHPDYATNLNNLALLFRDMGQYEKAEPLWLETKSIREKTLGKEHPAYADIVNYLADLWERQSRSLEAEPLLTEGLDHALIRLMRATSFLSEQELAQYTNTFQKSGNRLSSFIIARQAKETQHGIIPNLVYDHALFHKGFLLTAASRLNALKLSSPESTEMNIQLKGYRRRLAVEYTKPTTERRNVAELEEKANSVEKELARTVAGYADAIRQVKWQEVQKSLKSDEAAIEFVSFQINFPQPSDSVMYAALLIKSESTQPTFIPLFEEKELTRKLSGKKESESNQLVAHIYTRGLVPLGRRNDPEGLYDLVWKPLDSLLTGIKKVYYSPAGVLNQINFDAIPAGLDSRDEVMTLADKYALVRLGSTRSVVMPDATQINTSNEIVLYGGIRYEMDTTLQSLTDTIYNEPIYASTGFTHALRSVSDRGGDWNYLPGTAHEIAEITSIAESVQFPVRVFQGNDATEETVKEIGRGKASPRILHFATHGFFFPDPEQASSLRRGLGEAEPVFKMSDNPMIRSGLILAGGNHAWQHGRSVSPDKEDGILTAYEISQMNLSNTELVVLSACETGLGDIQGNEGVYGLQRAFKIAGAKYLIMSLWQVPDKQTSLLMTTFYKKWLEEKMTIPEAFHAAQKQLRDNGLDPYNWAGFVLVE